MWAVVVGLSDYLVSTQLQFCCFVVGVVVGVVVVVGL